MSATDGENVEKVAKLLKDDRRYTCTEIAHELDISHGFAHSILTVVVVVLLFYVHGKHLRSCRDGHLT